MPYRWAGSEPIGSGIEKALAVHRVHAHAGDNGVAAADRPGPNQRVLNATGSAVPDPDLSYLYRRRPAPDPSPPTTIPTASGRRRPEERVSPKNGTATNPPTNRYPRNGGPLPRCQRKGVPFRSTRFHSVPFARSGQRDFRP